MLVVVFYKWRNPFLFATKILTKKIHPVLQKQKQRPKLQLDVFKIKNVFPNSTASFSSSKQTTKNDKHKQFNQGLPFWKPTNEAVALKLCCYSSGHFLIFPILSLCSNQGLLFYLFSICLKEYWTCKIMCLLIRILMITIAVMKFSENSQENCFLGCCSTNVCK